MRVINKYYCDVFDLTSEGNLIIIDKNILSIDNIKLEGKFNNFSQFDNKIFTYNNVENKTVFYDIKTLRKIYSSHEYLGVRTDIDKRKVKESYFGQTETIDKELWAFINKNSFEVIRTIETNIANRNLLLVSDNHFISKNKDSLALKNIIDNEILWQHSFSELLEAEQGDDFIFQNGNIVVHNGIIYFSLFENNRHLNTVTVCIDVETGKIEKKHKGFAGNLTLFSNKIAIAGDKVVEILDLETQTILKKDYSKYLEADNLSISWNSFKIMENELFYFIASDHRQGSYIGIIDLKADKLIWLQALNPDKEIYDIGALDFKVSDNRMYVHCSDKSLYIFEKE